MSKSVMDHMPSYIKSRRESMGLSMGELARRTGCSKAHIWALEHGDSANPTIGLLESMCEALECGLPELLGITI